MGKMTSLILVVILLSEISIAVLMKPENSTYQYYLVWLWVIFLTIANWFASVAIFLQNNGKKQRNSELAILPSLNISVFLYSLVSIGFILLYQVNVIPYNLHLIIQIIALCLIIVISTFLLLSARAQQEIESKVTKDDFIRLCRKLQISENEIFVKKTRELMDFINQKMPHFSKLDQEKLESIYNELLDCQLDDSNQIDLIKNQLMRI